MGTRPTEAERELRRQIVAEHLRAGDTITHERCMGIIEEHIFDGRDGAWLCGRPTHDTRRLARLVDEVIERRATDISPGNVTHINRVPVEAVPMLAEIRARERKS